MKKMPEIRQINFIKIASNYPNQEELAAILGVTASYVSQLVTGHRAMGEKTARKFERELKLPIYSMDSNTSEYIEGESVRIYELKEELIGNTLEAPVLVRKIPLINYVQAGRWAEIIDTQEPLEWIDTNINVSCKSFALRVIGDSMTNPFGAPSIPEGFIVIVDPEIQAQHGSIVVARLENYNEAMLKQLIIDGPNRYLKPLNPNYRTIEIKENCVICGVVKKVQYDL